MTQEVLIPKMKRLDSSQKKIRIPILNIILIIFFTLLLVFATFINCNIQHYVLPFEYFKQNNNLAPGDFISSFYIIPQIPIVMFICSCLGKKMAVTCIVLYIFCGIFLAPLFALGGGIKYIGEYSFGYIMAFVPAVITAGNFLKVKYSFLNIFLATIVGVLLIHLIGIVYMVFIALIKQDGGNFITGWIASQSGIKIIYDLILSFVLVLIGKYVNSFIKFIIN